jgi:hypothetical protein
MEDKKVSNVQFVVGSNAGHDCTIFHSLSTDAPQSSFRSVEMYTTTKLTSSLVLEITQKDRLKNKKRERHLQTDRKTEEEIDNNVQKRKRATDRQTERRRIVCRRE